MILTDTQAEALRMIKEWANEEYKSKINPDGAFARGINAAKWEIQQLLNMGKL